MWLLAEACFFLLLLVAQNFFGLVGVQSCHKVTWTLYLYIIGPDREKIEALPFSFICLTAASDSGTGRTQSVNCRYVKILR